MNALSEHRMRFWQILLGGTAVILTIFLTIGSDYARRGIDHIVRMVATSRVEDWAAHLSEKHERIFMQFGKAPLPDAEIADLRREAEIYGIEAFRIIPRHEPLGKMRLYARNTFEPGHREIAIAAFSTTQSDQEGSTVHVSVPLHAADGRRIGEIHAVVDQKRLHKELTNTAWWLMSSAMLALAFILLMVIFLFRRMQFVAVRHINHAREYDELTGLPNHAAFEQAAAELLSGTAPEDDDGEGHAIACITFGVDNLGHITCAEGHEAVSHVLRTLSGRFARIAHAAGTQVFRLRRDDFGILLPIAAEPQREARTFTHQLLQEAQRPVYWHGKSLLMTLSVGMSFYPHQARSLSELVRQATLMRQAASEAGGNTLRIYNSESDREYHERVRLERLLRKAARNCAGYFSLHYQPIVDLQRGGLHGFEVLLRMNDDEGNPVSPGEFIPIAEQLNLMDEIGAYVLSEACASAVQWPAHLKVSVNLSPTQFHSGKLVSSVVRALETSGLDARRLELEVTESVMMREWEKVSAQLQALQQRGASIVLDDFGTGYSSMSYLWKFNFNKLKIDRSFTQALNSCDEARAILRSLVIMARSLKMPVVVEGIETLEQAAFLRKFRCDYGQGYYFGRPMPAHDLAAAIMRDWGMHETIPAGAEVITLTARPAQC